MKTFLNSRANRKAAFNMSVLKIFRELIPAPDTNPGAAEEVNRVKELVAAWVGRDRNLHFTMHRGYLFPLLTLRMMY